MSFRFFYFRKVEIAKFNTTENLIGSFCSEETANRKRRSTCIAKPTGFFNRIHFSHAAIWLDHLGFSRK